MDKKSCKQSSQTPILEDCKIGDIVLLVSTRSGQMIETTIAEVSPRIIICRWGMRNDKLYFYRSGKPCGKTFFTIVARGKEEIDCYRKKKHKRRVNNPVDDNHYSHVTKDRYHPLNPQLAEKARVLGERVRMHVGAGQFSEAVEIITFAKQEWEELQEEIKQTIHKAGVGCAIGKLGLPSRIVNSLDASGINEVSQLTSLTADELEHRVANLGPVALRIIADTLSYYGFASQIDHLCTATNGRLVGPDDSELEDEKLAARAFPRLYRSQETMPKPEKVAMALSA